MNYLELCQRVAADGGISTSAPASVLNQSGILSLIVHWVRQADKEIQLHRKDWRFLWGEANKTLIKDVGTYTKTDLNIPTAHDISVVTMGATALTVGEYQDYVYHIASKSLHTQKGTPTHMFVKPNDTVVFFPIPASPHSIHIEYYSRPVELQTNTDVSVIPGEYHEAIVARALMFFADHQEDNYLYQKKSLDYKQWLNHLAGTQAPKMGFE